MIRSSGTMNILLEERMTYTLPLSLKRIALIKIATTLWNQTISAFNTKINCWEIQEKVIEKVPQLALPETLKKEILACVLPIGLRIFKWMKHQIKYLNRAYIVKNLSKLCWTPQGIIDDKKTAETLIKDENLDITERYKLACINFLEDDVRELWRSMPQRKKSLFNNELHAEDELISLWTYCVKMKVDKLKINIEEISPFQFNVESAALSENKAATEFILPELMSRESIDLVTYVGYVVSMRYYFFIQKGHSSHVDVLCLLLSQMNEELQVKVFERYSYPVLLCFLDWPWQSFFIETANRVRDFLSESQYANILTLIVKKVWEGYKDCDYQKLFGELWQLSPNICKRYVIGPWERENTLFLQPKFVIGECALKGKPLLEHLFDHKAKESISLILKTVTLTEKEKIIFGFTGEKICRKLVYRNEWNLLTFFISECIASQETMIKLKEEFKNRAPHCRSVVVRARKKYEWDRFVQLIDDLIHGYDKRKSIEEVGGNPAKKLCSIEFEEVTPRKEECSSLNQ